MPKSNQVIEWLGAYHTMIGVTAYRFVGTKEEHDNYLKQKESIYKECLKGPFQDENI